MWIITKDFEDSGKSVGVRSHDYDESMRDKLTHCFRLLDADNEVYYEGFSDDCDSEKAFAPLDDFGGDFAGCVEIKYLQAGIWKIL